MWIRKDAAAANGEFHIFWAFTTSETRSFVRRNELLMFAGNNCSCKCMNLPPIHLYKICIVICAQCVSVYCIQDTQVCVWIITTIFCIEHLNWTHKLHPFVSCERINTKELLLLPVVASCFTRLRCKFIGSWCRRCVFFVFFLVETNSNGRTTAIGVTKCIACNWSNSHKYIPRKSFLLFFFLPFAYFFFYCCVSNRIHRYYYYFGTENAGEKNEE